LRDRMNQDYIEQHIIKRKKEKTCSHQDERMNPIVRTTHNLTTERSGIRIILSRNIIKRKKEKKKKPPYSILINQE
jgi:hypothetical protein